MITARLMGWISNAETLRHRATLASFWTVGGFGVQKLLQLVSNLILTRLLFPQAFGLMTLANVILIGIGMFSDVGIKPAIVQSERGDQEDFLNTAWTLQVIRGFGVWGVACLIAWPASLLYHQPVLIGLMCVLGSTAAIGGFTSTSLALREKRLHLGALVGVQLLGQFLTLSVTAVFAWLLHSVWALALGSVASALITTILGFLVMPGHRHHFVIEPESVRSLLRFGRWIFASTLVTYLGGQGLRAIQGALIPIGTLGILGIAQTFAMMPAELSGRVQDLVGFPALSEARQGGHEKFARVFVKIRTRVILGALALFLIFALLSGPLVWTLYDRRYHAAGGYMALLCITGPFEIIAVGYQSAFLALGKVRLHANLLAVFMVTKIIGTVVGYQTGGVVGMLIGVGLGTLVGYILVAYYAEKDGLFSIKLDALVLTVVAGIAIMVKYLYFQ